MIVKESLKIAILEPSLIIRSGIVVVLRKIPRLKLQPVEILSLTILNQVLSTQTPDILIINPTYWGTIDLVKLREENNLPNLKCIALVYAPLDENLLKQYDETFNLFEDNEQLGVKIERLFESISSQGNHAGAELLSLREKEIITCVVKGQTNKEIAGTLFLSAHTVITHRRNIARKLGIHSTAGLTVYAIVNKLVELDEVKKK